MKWIFVVLNIYIPQVDCCKLLTVYKLLIVINLHNICLLVFKLNNIILLITFIYIVGIVTIIITSVTIRIYTYYILSKYIFFLILKITINIIIKSANILFKNVYYVFRVKPFPDLVIMNYLHVSFASSLSVTSICTFLFRPFNTCMLSSMIILYNKQCY